MKKGVLIAAVIGVLLLLTVYGAHAVIDDYVVSVPTVTVYTFTEDEGLVTLLYIEGNTSIHKDLFGNVIIAPKEQVDATFYYQSGWSKRLLDEDDFIIIKPEDRGILVRREVVEYMTLP